METQDYDRKERIEFLIDRNIAPGLAKHNGAVQVVSFDDATKTAFVRVRGQMPSEVVRRAVWGMLKNALPGEVEQVLDAPEDASAAPQQSEEDVQRREHLRQVFDEQINPALASHGGFAEVVDLVDNQLFIRVGGGCQGCSSSMTTVKRGIQGLVHQLYPGLLVVDTTDHASGENPYYR